MLLKVLSLLATTCVVAAVPARRQWPGYSYPPTSSANAFTLVANITGDQTGVFTPPLATSSWSLTGNHIGANLNLGILDPGAGAIFFINGTGPEISGQATSIGMYPAAYTDSNGTWVYEPTGMTFSTGAVEANILLDINPGTRGAGIVGGLRSPWPLLFTPFGEGPYTVCNISNAAYGNPSYRVGIPVGGLDGAIPENCVAMNLLAQCAVLPELVGVEELNIIQEPVECYEDVSAIDWSLYSP